MRLISVFLILTFAIPATAESQTLSAQKKFVADLFQNQKYFECVSETRRLIALDPDTKNHSSYSYFILLNYYYGGQYRSIVDSLTNRGRSDSGSRTEFIYAYSLFNAGYPGRAIESLQSFEYTRAEPDMRYELMLRKIDLMILADRYDAALDEIIAAEIYTGYEKTKGLKDAINSFNNVKPPSPVIAGGLTALLPGSGHIYAGTGFLSGALTFLSVALPAAASVYAYKSGNRNTAYAAGAFAVVFYSGAIYSASRSAEIKKSEMRSRFKDELRENYIPLYNPESYLDIDGLLK